MEGSNKSSKQWTMVVIIILLGRLHRVNGYTAVSRCTIGSRGLRQRDVGRSYRWRLRPSKTWETCIWRERQSAERRSEIRQTNLTGHAEGCACLSEERRSEIRQTDLMGHAEGHACLSEKQRSEIRQTDWTGHA